MYEINSNSSSSIPWLSR